jgi:hypothetical protein
MSSFNPVKKCGKGIFQSILAGFMLERKIKLFLKKRQLNQLAKGKKIFIL